MANIVIGNKRRVCLEKGIPIEVFERAWDEYRETNTFHGRFFHRQEIPSKEKDNVIRMKAAIAEMLVYTTACDCNVNADSPRIDGAHTLY